MLRRRQVLPAGELGVDRSSGVDCAPQRTQCRHEGGAGHPERGRPGSSPCPAEELAIWSVPEARQFLESARRDDDPLYAGYVLMLILGLRRGELLGLAWDDIDLASGEAQVL